MPLWYFPCEYNTTFSNIILYFSKYNIIFFQRICYLYANMILSFVERSACGKAKFARLILKFGFSSLVIEESCELVCFSHVTYTFVVNLHSEVGWMSRNSLLETGVMSENQVAATRFEPTNTLFANRQWTIKPTRSKLLNGSRVWPHGWVFVYELSDCEFESRCRH